MKNARSSLWLMGFVVACAGVGCSAPDRPTPSGTLDVIDEDADGIPNDMDNCAILSNVDQVDADADGTGDACDACPADAMNDVDQDGVCADKDNCPILSNADQVDADADGTGDACDACPADPMNDVDQDGVCADKDNCPILSNVDQVDADADGMGDACDACPADAMNDVDQDGVCADKDNCPILSNADQVDTDTDGTGDACDVETCDSVDNDGDGAIDEDFPDKDGKGFADCFDNDGDGVTEEQGDCNDENGTIYPGATETWYDLVDSDCDGNDNPSACEVLPPSSDVMPTSGCLIDLEPRLVSLCNGDCVSSTQLVLEILHHGQQDVSTPVNVTVYGVTNQGIYNKIGTQLVNGPFLAGRSSGGQKLDIAPFTSIYAYSQIAVQVDDTGAGAGTVTECDETNNRAQLSIAQLTCPAPDACETLPPGLPVASDPNCEYVPAPDAFQATVEWQKTFTPGYGGGAMSTPVVGNLTDDNGDGRIDAADIPDIAYTDLSGNLRVISGNGGTLHWSQPGLNTSYGGTAIGDIDNDGSPEVFALDPSGNLRAFSHNGQPRWTAPTAIAATHNYPAIADWDADGTAEVLVGHKVVRNNGQIALTTQLLHNYISFFADMDLDGKMEIVSGAGVSNFNGTTRWTANGGFAAVGNFDADTLPEVVIVSSGTVRLHDNSGQLLWTTSVPGGGGGAPTIADFDGDGAPEIGVAGGSAYVVIETNGTIRWQRQTQDNSSQITGSSVYDFNGDGAAEVVYSDELSLWVFDGATGNVLLKEDGHTSGTWFEYPVVADVDRDGHVEIVMTSNLYLNVPGWSGITVLGDPSNQWVTGRPVWNQHAYHITNVNDDLSIPVLQSPNWIASNNSFRQGGFGSIGAHAAADLAVTLVDMCQECNNGTVRILYQVENLGANTAGAGVPWTLYGIAQNGTRTAIAQGTISEAIAPGASTSTQTYTLATAIGATYQDFVLAVDDVGDGTGIHPECNETNNHATFPRPCQ